MDHPQSKQPPLSVCPACGGNWFSAPTYYRFLREELLGGYWPTWPHLVGQYSQVPTIIAVCLCGMPQSPNMGSNEGGPRFRQEMTALRQSLENSQYYLGDAAIVLEAEQEAELIRAESLQAFPDRLNALEAKAGRWLAQTNPERHSPRGRYWAPPARKPASGRHGTVTRDGLVVELQSRGLLFREARQAVKAINIMIEHLQMGGTVETLMVYPPARPARLSWTA